ncbi:MAG: hypothetical protein DCC50_11855 [Acidobacteria bacterium]|nr:MAG: hypothetical protein DCC50_11855 [Acidobacteriota bacterium]
MKAAPQMQARLLDLLDIDTRLDQLDHRIRTLPELTDIARMEGEAADLEAEVVRAQTTLSDLEREVARAEAAVQQVRDRTERNQKRLDSGAGSAKDLQGMQHELESLEQAQAEADEAERRRADHAARLDELRAARDEKTAAATAERQEVARGRDAVVADLSGELLALYDRVRAHTGSGAAELLQRRCGGCRLELNAVDLSRIRSAEEDEVLRCEECGRILVRTAESGL